MIILASTSQTRQALLRSAGLSFSAIAPDIDERALAARNPGWRAEDLALRLAEAKATDVSARYPDAIVIGADQVLACHGKVYSKPASIVECREQLLELRGTAHALISAVVCARSGKPAWAFSDTAALTMREFSLSFLDSYLEAAGNDCTTSVGGYKIEGRGLQLFEKIEGNYFTILGLPLIPLLDYLRRAGEIQA